MRVRVFIVFCYFRSLPQFLYQSFPGWVFRLQVGVSWFKFGIRISPSSSLHTAGLSLPSSFLSFLSFICIKSLCLFVG